MSYVMVTDNPGSPPLESSKSDGDRQVSTAKRGPRRVDVWEQVTRLFEILSARSDIDHPVCAECVGLLIKGMEETLQSETREREAYRQFLNKLNQSVPTDEEVREAEKSLQSTLVAEEEAFQELLTYEKGKDELDAELLALEDESRALDREEEDFWRARNECEQQLSEAQNEADALNARHIHELGVLERLQRTNVYNDVFFIGHSGSFGTINGLRLGRLAKPRVEWVEINAAWGQTLLLLATVAEKLNFQFQGYRLRPMGSTSRIEKLVTTPSASVRGSFMSFAASTASSPTRRPGATSPPPITRSSTVVDPSLPVEGKLLDLFHSGGSIPFLNRGSFDEAMVAFLECLRQLGNHVEHTPPSTHTSPSSTSSPHPHPPTTMPTPTSASTTALTSTLKMPYEIHRDKINGFSIKLGFNQSDENWTHACKYALTCCKFLLAHTSKVT